MATSTIPKSEFRKNDNIVVGFGEVPAVDVEGVPGWGLPGGYVTFSEEAAINYATILDREINKRMADISQLITAN